MRGIDVVGRFIPFFAFPFVKTTGGDQATITLEGLLKRFFAIRYLHLMKEKVLRRILSCF